MSKDKLIIMIIKSVLELGALVLGVVIVSMVINYIQHGYPGSIWIFSAFKKNLIGVGCLLYLLIVLRFRFIPYLLSRRK